MNFQFTNPLWLLLWPPGMALVIWLFWRTHVQISPWRRWTALIFRILVLTCLVLAVAGLQWLRPMEGMNLFYMLDRSDSLPSSQQEVARGYVNKSFAFKKTADKAAVCIDS